MHWFTNLSNPSLHINLCRTMVYHTSWNSFSIIRKFIGWGKWVQYIDKAKVVEKALNLKSGQMLIYEVVYFAKVPHNRSFVQLHSLTPYMRSCLCPGPPSFFLFQFTKILFHFFPRSLYRDETFRLCYIRLTILRDLWSTCFYYCSTCSRRAIGLDLITTLNLQSSLLI